MLQLIRRYRELVLAAVLLVFPFAVYVAHARQPPARSALDRAVLLVTAPIERAVGAAVTGILEVWDGYLALRGARARAERLVRENRRLELERQQLGVERAENERLRRLLGIAAAGSERRYVGARVVGIRIGPAGLQILTIDRGSGDGLARAMPVVTADGLVGRIHSTTGGTADVLLVVDRNSSVAVRVERTRVRADVRGLGRPELARLDYALRVEDVIEGDRLVTSGTDAVFPPGIPVGRVTHLRRGSHGLFVEAEVIPAVDPTRVEEVLVVTSGARPEDALPPVPGAEPVP